MNSVTPLIHRFRQGSESAFGQIFGLFYPLRVAHFRKRLGRAYPGPHSAEDLANSVFHRLWIEVMGGQPVAAGLTNRLSLLRILAILSAQKLREVLRHDYRKCRDVRRTIREADLPSGDGLVSPLDQAASPIPAPGSELILRDTVCHLLGLLTARQQIILMRRLDRFSEPEIAHELNCSIRSVERHLSVIRGRCGDHPDLRDLL